MSESKQAVFQVIPRPGEREWRKSFVTVQTHDDVKSGLLIPGVSKIETPDQRGMYVIPGNDPYRDKRVAAMTQYASAENARSGFIRIAGPFATVEEAANAVHKHRPRTSEEVAQEAVKAKDDAQREAAELKLKIAELEKKLTKKD